MGEPRPKPKPPWRRILARFGLARTSASRIVRSYDRTNIRLLLLEPDQSGDEFERIAVWRGILRSREYDVLITCDRFLRPRTSNLRRKEPFVGGDPFATHRITIVRVSRVLFAGKIRTDCLFLADVDLVQASVKQPDGYALPIVASIALQLLKRGDRELKLLFEFESEEERKMVWLRWRSVLRAYASDYFPIEGKEMS